MAASTATSAALYAIELRTTRWPQMLSWYRNILGARGLIRVEEDGYALVDLGGARLALLARTPTGEPSVRWSLAFEVDDLNAAISRLREAGTPVDPPTRDEESLIQVRCLDPDGNSIRLFAWPANPL